MSKIKKHQLVLLLFAFALVLAACGGGESVDVDSGAAVEEGQVEEAAVEEGHAGEAAVEEGHEGEAAGEEGDEHAEGMFTFGEPAEASEADREIAINANDDFTFGPNEVTVTAGETITFVVTNTGQIPHEFVLGDEAMQDAHEAEMAAMATTEMAHDDDNAVMLSVGETKELTWHFNEAGTVLIGCHQPGHYAAGMKAAVNVEA